ncbi:L-aspartate oxidase [Crossiella sp. CA-258035]|uniref:L-aspartate oxidase n=1 Tax=Crossiella sp. CA-258035 TaxID=2981138 RepID=UPI0024BC9835|nr:L-aspartate oxidase [Crossiella sp. CA-258035]WHT17832.1 L-aspartate oxidase [Crossiella sp. CA-258035]
MPRWEARADLVVVGTGVAGLTAALRATELGLRVLVVTKAAAEEGNTRWAQGGIAVVLDGEHEPGDSVGKHLADTLTAGAGLCDEVAARAILAGGPAAVGRLRRRGAVFDAKADGRLARTREGGHSAYRVVHAGGDATGAEVERALLASAADGRLTILERHTAVDVLRAEPVQVGPRPGSAVSGLLVLDETGNLGVLAAPAVLLATGGLGQLYAATSNPEVATADGLALALRAGATAADLEFTQFHPTVLYTGSGARGRRPLVTEAVRGEGAVLVDGDGARVMAGVHPLADLAPRDVVAAAITRRMNATGVHNVYLDATGLGPDTLGVPFAQRFPSVHAACVAAGIDPAVDPIPVAPACHYACGGVMSTVDGRTAVTGLYVVGEVARTGLHGANRLASNSLLEGLVGGERVAEAVALDLGTGLADGHRAPVRIAVPVARIADRDTLQLTMSRHAGVGRSALGLAEAAGTIGAASAEAPLRSRAEVEDAALTLAAAVLLDSAAARTETRGCHVREDCPATDDLGWRRSIAVRLGADGRPELMRWTAMGGAA